MSKTIFPKRGGIPVPNDTRVVRTIKHQTREGTYTIKITKYARTSKPFGYHYLRPNGSVVSNTSARSLDANTASAHAIQNIYENEKRSNASRRENPRPDTGTLLRKGTYVDLRQTANQDLILQPTPSGTALASELMQQGFREHDGLQELINDHLEDNWDRVLPDEIGALTDAPIISQEVLRTNDGAIVFCGQVFYHELYEVESLLDSIASGQPVRFKASGKHLPKRVFNDYDQLHDRENSGEPVNWSAFIEKWSPLVNK